MAKRVIHELIDDLDGSKADETIRFAIEGVEYEIDLSKGNYNKFQSALLPFVSAGTKVGRVQRPGYQRTLLTGNRPAPTDRDRNHAIRGWLQETGFAINERGRIRGDFVEFWEQRAKLDETALNQLLSKWGTDEVKAKLAAAQKPPVPAQKAAPATESTPAANGSKPATKAQPAAKKTAPAKKTAAAAAK